MAKIVFDPAKFRLAVPEFKDPEKWPDVLLQMYWDQAICLMEDESYCECDCTELQLFMMTAHLLKIQQNVINKNKQGGFVNSSSIDKISVSKIAPPAADMFEWWLGQTPYGQQLLVMLQVNAVGGFSVGGLPEGSAFRKVYGVF